MEGPPPRPPNPEGIKVIHLKKFVSKPAVEGFGATVLPRRAGFDGEGCPIRLLTPFLHLLGDEL